MGGRGGRIEGRKEEKKKEGKARGKKKGGKRGGREGEKKGEGRKGEREEGRTRRLYHQGCFSYTNSLGLLFGTISERPLGAALGETLPVEFLLAV